MDRNKNKNDEINKVILEWLIIKNYNKSSEIFCNETGLKPEEASKGNALEKRWGTILTLQKKISDMESQIKTLKDDLENAGNGGSQTIAKIENESMV
jgi:hypothetical protein